jgi:rod shape-determining protein MreB
MFRSKRIAIDLGTANTVVMLEDGTVVVQEPTVVAYSLPDHKILAVGLEAKQMLGKVPEGIKASRPMRDGGIANYRATEAMLKRFIQKAIGDRNFLKPEVIISVPAGITSVEERAVIQALAAAGVGKSYLLPEPIAAALGAELPIHESAGNMIVNLGGGTAEIAVLSMNGIVNHSSKRGAGDAINSAVVRHLRKQYNLVIGEQMAERIKFEIGSAVELGQPLKMEVKGSDASTGMPRSIDFDSNQLVTGIRPVLTEIVSEVIAVLEKTHPELTSDIIDRGIVLSGGTALLRNFDELMAKAVGVPTHVADEPLLCVVRGLNLALRNIDILKRSFK